MASKKQSAKNHSFPKETVWHSASHVLATAVKELFLEAKFGIGPAIDEGFYYDFLVAKPFSPQDLEAIEKKANEIIKQDLAFERKEISKKEAQQLFKTQAFKLELIEELEEGKISTYSEGSFTDLCKGPHVQSTGQIGVLKVLKSSAAYWKGTQDRESMQRIYGIAFPTQPELDAWLKLKKDAEDRSHLKLGKDLNLFLISPEVGPGLPLFTPEGTIIREELQKFLREEQLKRGYLPVVTPHITKAALYKTSGHLELYKDSMFPVMKTEGDEYYLKPMNCPHHIQIYQSKLRSYRELPLRYTEFGTVYRLEKSGELTGLTRVRMITQDDAHLFCTPGQVKDEILGIINLVLKIFKILDFKDYFVRFGTRDNSGKYMASDEAWISAEKNIEESLKESGLKYFKAEGEAAFYGPKIDFVVKDVLGREWQLGTIQIDYNMPESFQLSYIGEDSKEHRPVMIHRAPFGSLERFEGILIEHFGGKFPLWLSPVQVKILAVSDKFNDYAQKISSELKSNNIRVDLDLSSNTVSYKIREAQLQKVPYVIVVGEREEKAGTVTVRDRLGKQFTEKAPAFLEKVLQQISERSLN
ncbi:MAG TPA: threonine--tRNA ligase [Candidatus Diapherotrites archaeon]|uniref:Threonine--tRNA ligase n=2 Tax=Candidatus Iainarchaeum sp. TaxID=3101447 RepID=A0A7J4JVR7_9ARCH|nr:threonine--tRNA ligase [Candidatus Diapherotrites archaeon]HIH32631.1 threonine--tRNA ligase [Candidatus Diapherotrites archaeon]